MSPPPHSITTLFVDLGRVLLTDSWGPAMRQRAIERFVFDLADVAERSRLAFEGYEEGHTSLDEYLRLVVFNEPRSFTQDALTEFMLEQSEPELDMIALIRDLRARYGLKVVVVTNDGREFIEHRVRKFGLTSLIDVFVVSCFVSHRKPEHGIYRMALDLTQVSPERVVYIDDQQLFVEAARNLGINGIHHTSLETTQAAPAGNGLVRSD